MNIFEFTFASIHGNNMSMSTYLGQPILLVNTASKCGYTPQYSGLQRLWEDFRQSGLVVIGVPSNDFGDQEPASEAVISKFCEIKYGVNFPMTRKYNVSGNAAHPVFRTLVEEFGHDVGPRWNFFKYLFSHEGQLLEFWPSKVVPSDPLFRRTVQQNLKSWVL